MDNDYFVTEFLLSLPLAGEYSARVETSLVDGKGELWTTGQQGGWSRGCGQQKSSQLQIWCLACSFSYWGDKNREESM